MSSSRTIAFKQGHTSPELYTGFLTGNLSPVFPILGACLCFAVRMAGMHYGIDPPIAPSERRRQPANDAARSELSGSRPGWERARP